MSSSTPNSSAEFQNVLSETRKPVERERFFRSERPIEMVCDRIARDFERGVSLRSLGIMYQMRVAVLEGILRDRLRFLEAGMRRGLVAV